MMHWQEDWLKFDRVLAMRDRVCDQCEDPITEGETYGKIADQKFCMVCVDYEATRGRRRGRYIED